MKKKPMKIVTKTWWALVRGPRDLPVIFASKQDAENNCEPDEYLVRVKVAEG